MDPTPDTFAALARSSPWRFRSLHLSHHQRTGTWRETRTVEAWVQRPGRMVVRDERGQRHEVADPGPTTTLVAVGRGGRSWSRRWGRRRSRSTTEVAVRPQEPWAPQPTLRPDGLVATRPETSEDGTPVDYDDPMWQDYQWVAMLDPAELSHHVELAEVYAADRHGRTTWWAQARVVEGYDPRCGCCPLLPGLVSMELEFGEESPTEFPRDTWGDLPSTYLVGLDLQSAVVVDVTPLDGDATLAPGFHLDIHGVDVPCPDTLA